MENEEEEYNDNGHKYFETKSSFHDVDKIEELKELVPYFFKHILLLFNDVPLLPFLLLL